MNDLEKSFTPKQIQVLQSDAKMIFLHGAKRSGKTVIMLWKFLMNLKKFKNKKFIMAGTTFDSIRTNMLDELSNITGQPITPIGNRFVLFGNTILLRAGMNADAWKRSRGFTAQGAILNEMTALHPTFIMEVISRCSEADSFIIGDTNTENPEHFVKTSFIDKAGEKLKDGRTLIDAYNFGIDDNTFLDPEYVESIKKATPSGFFYDRDILGLWVPAEGIVYRDFDYKTHVIDKIPEGEVPIRYIGGMDFGYKHFGTSIVIVRCASGNYYYIDEVAEQNQFIEFWGTTAQAQMRQYPGLMYYPDTARPDYITELRKRYGLRMGNTHKTLLEGIQFVGSLIKQKKLFFLRSAFKRGLEEIKLYVWKDVTEGDETVVKTNDDVMDSIRYALYSDHIANKSGVFTKPRGL